MRTDALLREATQRLAAAGVPSPSHDAQALLEHLTGKPLPLIETVDETAYRALVDERAARVPLQHLTGTTGFRRLELAVGPGVFVPRPETEVLVDWVLPHAGGAVVVDLCAGSGAIALSIADESTATVYAVELDVMAVAWARRNIERTGLPVTLVHGNIAAALPELDGTVDVVVANPPYIPVGATVEPEVAQHDPPLALWGGADGLDVIRVVSATAERLLRPGGVVAIEHADLQGTSVPALLERVGSWSAVTDHRDLAGRPRYTTARKSE